MDSRRIIAMHVKDAIDRRRAYRSLEPVGITEDIINDLATAAHKAPSCFNNQPWRLVFVHGRENLERMHEALSRTNDWARRASLMVVMITRPDLDCRPKDRDYNLFDTGMATAFLMLRATEMGLVAHPTAGYKVKRTREILGIPEDFTIATIIHVGRQAGDETGHLEEWQQERERGPRLRRPLETVVHHNWYDPSREPADLEDRGSGFGWPTSEWMDADASRTAGDQSS